MWIEATVPTSSTVISANLTADADDDYLLTGNLVSSNEATIAQITGTDYTVALYDENGDKVDSYDSSSTYQFGGTNAGAGTYYLVFTLTDDNAWSDGDTLDYVCFTIVITQYAPVSLPTVDCKGEDDDDDQTGKWEQTGENAYTISLDELTDESGTVTAIGFFETFTASEDGVEDIEVSVHSGSADSSALTTSEAGTYTVTVTLEDGYVWEDGNGITDNMASVAPGTYETIRFALADGYAWSDGTTDDITFTLVIGGNVKLPTSDTVIDTGSMDADKDDDLYITGSVAGGATIAQITDAGTTYTVTLYEADGTTVVTSDFTSGYTFTAEGTYYLVFTLESGNAWSDGDTLDYVYFTLVIGGNVKLPTSDTVIDTGSMDADKDDDL